MAIHTKVGAIWKAITKPYVKVGDLWKIPSKVFVKDAGVWKEVWPLTPDAPPPGIDPTNPAFGATITAPYQNDRIEVVTNWQAAVAPPTITKYQVRLVLRNPTTGQVSYTTWVDRTPAQLNYTFNDNGTGYQNYSANWRVKSEIKAFSASGAGPSAFSPEIQVPRMPPPPAPTAYDINVSGYVPSHTWSHVGGNRLDGFDVEVWLTGYSHATQHLSAAARSSTLDAWTPDTLNGRYQANFRVRATGPGGDSAWVTITGYLPGPALLSDLRFEAGVMKVKVNNVHDDLNVWTQVINGPWVAQADHTTSNTDITASGSGGWPRDGITKRRFVLQPVNPLNGWTGRVQYSNWAIKIPNPVYFEPGDSNTWWSLPNPGKWRTNPQAEDWFYQGRSISGNSVGTLFFGSAISTYLSSARIGYVPAATNVQVYIRRAWTGGLASPVAPQIWTHNEPNDLDDSFPTLIDGPYNGTAIDRSQGIWQGLPVTWYSNLRSGAAKGLAFYISVNAPDNQMRYEIGNVSNRYIIFDKPNYGPHLDGRPPGTIRIYHDA